MLTPEVKARAIDLAGRLVGQYMQRGNFRACAFVLHRGVSPLGIRALRDFPIEWYPEIKVPGFVVERVGERGVRIY